MDKDIEQLTLNQINEEYQEYLLDHKKTLLSCEFKKDKIKEKRSETIKQNKLKLLEKLKKELNQ